MFHKSTTVIYFDSLVNKVGNGVHIRSKHLFRHCVNWTPSRPYHHDTRFIGQISFTLPVNALTICHLISWIISQNISYCENVFHLLLFRIKMIIILIALMSNLEIRMHTMYICKRWFDYHDHGVETSVIINRYNWLLLLWDTTKVVTRLPLELLVHPIGDHWRYIITPCGFQFASKSTLDI